MKLINYKLQHLGLPFLLLPLYYTDLYWLAVIISSVAVFYIISLNKTINLSILFMYVLPSMVDMSGHSIEYYTDYYFNYRNVLLVGSLSLSTKLIASIAVPVRILMTYSQNKYPILVIAWFILLVCISYELLWSYFNDLSSNVGLTSGLRIVLVMGILLLPVNCDRKSVINQTTTIFKISLLLFLIGYPIGHWFFILLGFIPFYILNREDKIFVIISIAALIKVTFLDLSFTDIIILGFAFLLHLLQTFKGKIFKPDNLFKSLRFFPFFFPFLFPFSIFYNWDLYEYFSNVYFFDKLFLDRGVLWTGAISHILKEMPLISDANTSFNVSGMLGYGDILWGSGAHNLYLEISVRSGLLALFLFILIVNNLFSSHYSFVNLSEKSYLISFLSIYLVFGLTGNSLAYDGVGFIYWMLLVYLIKSRSSNSQLG